MPVEHHTQLTRIVGEMYKASWNELLADDNVGFCNMSRTERSFAIQESIVRKIIDAIDTVERIATDDLGGFSLSRI